MNFLSKEVKIGITAIVAIIFIYAGIIFLKGLKMFNNDNSYYVEMNNASGLSVSGEVLANGVKVGYVKAISYVPEKQNIKVELSINQDFQIPAGTTAYLTKEMLGSPKLNLTLGENSGKYLSAGDTMTATESADLMTAAGDMIPQIQALIPKLDSILAGVNALANDPALAASLHNMEYITGNLKTTTDNVNSLLGRDLPRLMTKANSICTNLEGTTAKLNEVDIVGISRSAKGTLDNAQSITENLNNAMRSKNNSLGMLLNDNSLAVHIDTTIINASLLLEDLRQNPKRYVHFSLFGKSSK